MDFWLADIPFQIILEHCFNQPVSIVKGVKYYSRNVKSINRVATVIESPGKSWNWGKKFPGPGKSWNLGRSPWKSWNRQNISFFISKNNKNVLLVKYFWYDSAVKQKPRLRKVWFLSKVTCHWLFFIVRIRLFTPRYKLRLNNRYIFSLLIAKFITKPVFNFGRFSVLPWTFLLFAVAI